MFQDEKDLNQRSNCVPGDQPAFFEQMQHFSFLAETVVADLKAGATLGREQHVRIWSAACSTGEEPFSIAITLLEALRGAPDSEAAIYQPDGWTIEVLASDFDGAALAVAAEGIYSGQSLAGLSPAAQKRYFLRGRGEEAERVRVKHRLAELVHFQQLNLKESDWTVEGLFDVIFFRNALVQFDKQTQELLLRRMLQHLQPHGYLILGRAEQLPWVRDAVLPTGNAIYQLRPHGKARYIGNERRTSIR